jgi:hypothetical protein
MGLLVGVEPGKSVWESEMTGYKSEQVIDLSQDVLLWWKLHSDKYMHPSLSTLARFYPSVLTTSVASERVFSTAGDVVSEQRALLTPENAETLVHLKKNKCCS